MDRIKHLGIRTRFWGLLGLVLLVGWSPLFFRGKIPVDGNLVRMSYPNWIFSHLWVTPFHWPLWNPFRDMGEPFLADPQTMTAYPVCWLLNPIWNFHVYLCVWVLVHSLIAAVFTGKLVKRWNGDTTAAWVAAVVISLNACFTSRLSIPNHFASAAFIPMTFYFLETQSIMGIGVSLALQWVAGFPPISVLTGLSLFVGSVFSRRPGAVRTLVWGGLFALGLAAVQWIPFIELLSHSSRPLVLPSGPTGQYSESWGQLGKMIFLPQWSWFAPQLKGDPAIVSFYVGLPVLGLVLWAGVRGGAREKGLMAGLLAACLLSLGTSLPEYQWFLPARLFRFPAHGLLIASWCAAMLCGAGISHIRSARSKMIFAAIIVFDLLGFAQAVRVAWMPSSFLTDVPASATQLLSSPYPARLYYPDPILEASLATSLENINDYALMKDSLYPSIGMAYGVREASSYQVLVLERARAFQERLSREGPSSPLLGWAGVSTVVTRRPAAAALDDSAFVMLRMKAFKPPLFIAEEGVANKIVPKIYKAGNVRAMVYVDKPATLVFSEVSYPGWRTFIDEEPVSSGLFEETFMSVTVPSGAHWVEFVYRPSSFRIGLVVTCMALLAGIVLLRKKDF